MAPVESLTPNPRNPNRHPKRQLELYAKAIAHNGWRRAIVVSKLSGLIVTGHGALQAAQLAGWSHVPVDDQDFATPEDERAHLLADNQLPELSEIDEAGLSALIKELDGVVPLDLAGFDDTALSDLLDSPQETKMHANRSAFEVVIECKSKADQRKWVERVKKAGGTCRLLRLA